MAVRLKNYQVNGNFPCEKTVVSQSTKTDLGGKYFSIISETGR